ncbi:hypothetical protein [Nitrosomonas communis]|uniref:hypothetical protein n=1 Tax=Nitrosomonas communis TaxID=44574 RepID=UPI003D2C458A
MRSILVVSTWTNAAIVCYEDCGIHPTADTIFTMLKLEPDKVADLERGKIVPFETGEATTQKN